MNAVHAMNKARKTELEAQGRVVVNEMAAAYSADLTPDMEAEGVDIINQLVVDIYAETIELL